jgi:hypothetical protein
MEEQSAKDYNAAANECSANADSVSKQIFELLVQDEERHFDLFDKQVGHRALVVGAKRLTTREEVVGAGGLRVRGRGRTRGRSRARRKSRQHGVAHGLVRDGRVSFDVVNDFGFLLDGCGFLLDGCGFRRLDLLRNDLIDRLLGSLLRHSGRTHKPVDLSLDVGKVRPGERNSNGH